MVGFGESEPTNLLAIWHSWSWKVAESRKEDGLVTSFFFFRHDPKWNNPLYLILSIAHGLVQNVPELRSRLNPTILEASLEDQFMGLVVQPLLEQQHWRNHSGAPARKPANLVIIDGLDKCGEEKEQMQILRILASELQKNFSPSFPLRFLVCSRPEPWIREEFDSSSLHTFTKHIDFQDWSFSPNEDIHCFLQDSFAEICTNPKFSQVQFPTPWPSDEAIETLVDHASGQFIYPATVLKFITDGYRHPLEKLQVILDISPIFRELDDLY